MVMTKEKILAAITSAVAAFTLISARVPAIEPVPEVPTAEGPRPYRAVTAAPRLSPEDALEIGRNPFSTKDPWQPATPAQMPVPPSASWPRALPGGAEELPKSPRDRLLVQELGGGQ